MRILLIDDEKDFLWLLGKNIESWEHEVVSASSGKEALELLGKSKVDLVVLDYLMPEEDGLEILKKLRKIDKKVPVIMLTAFPDKRSMDEANKFGVLAYVPKDGVAADGKDSLKTAIGMAQKKITA